MNSIYLRRCSKVLIKPGECRQSRSVITALQENIKPLGFALSIAACDRLRTLSTEKLASFYRSLVTSLREMTGANRVFEPMYPNFPDQVTEATDFALWRNAIVHYLTNQLPKFNKKERAPLTDEPKLRPIDLGSKQEFEALFTQLAAEKTALSALDLQDIAWFVAQYQNNIVRMMPSEIPTKETLAFIGAQLVRHTTLPPVWFAERFRTATDVLRLAAALHSGDVSLAAATKFGAFRRAERKLLLSLLEEAPNCTEDMLRYKERWKRLGERLHPGDYAEKLPKAFASFRSLRHDAPVLTFRSRVERALSERNVAQVLELLGSRPGELARRLDQLLRMGSDADSVIAAFESAAPRVSSPVLLQVLCHFTQRGRKTELRVFFPKGSVARAHAEPNNLPALSADVCKRVCEAAEAALLRHYGTRTPLGRCYLDPALTSYLVPFSQRSASKTLRTLVRGSRLPLPAGNVLRFFLWWKNGKSRTDIDLSAAMFDVNKTYADVLSYYNLQSMGGCHSGDIVDAPRGAAEFIDIDIPALLGKNIRYVVMAINSFSRQPFCDLPECFAGWMSRTSAGSGEIFEPRTVQDKVDIAAATETCLPAIFDLQDRQVIWADIALGGDPQWNNVDENLGGVSLMLRALTELVKPDLATLFALHIRARGVVVAHPSEAETVFSVDRGVTPFDIPRIMSDFL